MSLPVGHLAQTTNRDFAVQTIRTYTPAAMPLNQRTWSFAVRLESGIDSPKGRKD